MHAYNTAWLCLRTHNQSAVHWWGGNKFSTQHGISLQVCGLYILFHTEFKLGMNGKKIFCFKKSSSNTWGFFSSSEHKYTYKYKNDNLISNNNNLN